LSSALTSRHEFTLVFDMSRQQIYCVVVTFVNKYNKNTLRNKIENSIEAVDR